MLVRLHPDLVIKGRSIYDQALDVRYRVTDDAALLLRYLRQAGAVDRMVRTVASKRSVSVDEVRTALYMLLGILDGYGGVVVREVSVYERFRSIRRNVRWLTRYPGTGKGFVRSMMRAYLWPALFGTAAFCGIWFASRASLPGAWILLPPGLLATCVVHEAGHALAAHHVRVRQVFLAKPGFAAVLYARPKHDQERLIALCGPLAAILLCMVVAIAVQSPICRLVCLTAALIHVCSIVPWTADGKTIWRKP